MNFGGSKAQSIGKIGIARSKDRNVNVPIITSQIVPEPVRPSDITFTRPFRSVFPAATYLNRSEPDIIMVSEASEPEG